MASTRLLQRSFLGGELSPEMFGRVDAAVYQNGAALLQNFISKPQGPAFRRPGFRYVAASKSSNVNDKCRLIPFTYSTDQTMVVELGTVTVTSGTISNVSTLITASGVNWTANEYAGKYIISNNNVGLILSNTSNQLAVSNWSPATPVVGDTFEIYEGYARFHTKGLSLFTGVLSEWADTANKSVSFVNGSSAAIFTTSSSHGFADGTAVVISGASITGGSVVVGTTYYVIYLTPTTFRLSATSGGGSALAVGTSTGANTVSKVYSEGDFVKVGNNGYYALTITSQNPSTTPSSWRFAAAYDSILGVPYEVNSPYSRNHLMDVHHVQSADVLTLTHNCYAARELSRLSATKWTLSEIAWSTGSNKPSGVSISIGSGQRRTITARSGSAATSVITVASNGVVGSDSIFQGDNVYIRCPGETSLNEKWFVVRAVDPNNSTQMSLNDFYTGAQWINPSGTSVSISGTIERLSYISDFTNYYVVTAVYEGNVESAPSSEVFSSNALYTNGNTNIISWTRVASAVKYNIYKKQSGVFGYIGSTSQTSVGTNPSFTDDYIAPDLGNTPPIYSSPSPLNSVANYPATVGYFEQRRCFASTINNPQTFYATRSFTDSDLSYRLPSQDDDRLQFRITSQQANSIRHIASLNELLLLTNSSEWRVTSINSDALTSDSISVRPQSYVGANMVQPEIVNNSLIFCSARGGHVRELGYNWQAQGFVTSDLSLRSMHLFDGYDIIDMCQSKAPHPVIWSVSSSGKLLGLTYIPEEQVAAWHQHTTAGTFQSCCTVSEGAEDVLYVIARRTINGTTRNYVERMAQMTQPTTLADCYMMDCGGTATGTNLTTVTGLDWLNGATVQVLADGKVHRSLTVSAGTITLDYAASKIQYGLPYVSNMQTLPVSMQIDGAGQGRAKNINKAWLRVSKTSGCKVGPDADHLVQTNLYESTPTEKTEEIPVLLTPAWSQDGRVYVQQSDPLPLTLVGLTIECAVGG